MTNLKSSHCLFVGLFIDIGLSVAYLNMGNLLYVVAHTAAKKNSLSRHVEIGCSACSQIDFFNEEFRPLTKFLSVMLGARRCAPQQASVRLKASEGASWRKQYPGQQNKVSCLHCQICYVVTNPCHNMFLRYFSFLLEITILSR